MFFPTSSSSQNIWDGYDHLFQPVKQHIAYQTTSEIIIDGKADEASWQLARWSDYFIDILGEKAADSSIQTRYKILWDKDFLYIFAELQEPHIWTYHINSQQTISNENDFEIFIDPDNDTHDYFEFEINAQNMLTDRFLPKARRNGGQAVWDWNIRNFKSAVSLSGTINNPADIDNKWTIEVAIPFRSLTNTDEYKVPYDGDFWKINFARVQWNVLITNGMYQKPPNGKFKYNWVWSPQYADNMHHPEQWGLVHFSSAEVGTIDVTPKIPIAEKYGNYLWFLYYKQMVYKKENLQYAQTLSKLGLAQVAKTKQGEVFLYEMDVKGHLFTLYITTKNRVKLSINQDGYFQVL